MRRVKFAGIGLYLFGLFGIGLGSLTLGSGCGGTATNEPIAKAERSEPTAEEQTGRQNAMKEAAAAKAKNR